MKTVIVTGAAGAQGRAIADAFRAAGHRVRGLVRSPRPGTDLIAIADGDSAALERVLAGADVLAITVPIDHRPGVREGLVERLVAAAARSGVGGIVLNTAATAPAGLDRPVAQVLRRLQAIVTGGPVPSAVIAPTIYMDNLAAPWSAPAIVGGVLAYPAPRHAPIAWISHATLAACAVAAADHVVAGGRHFAIGGPENLSGEAVAAVLGDVLGHPVRYEQTPFDDFAAAINAGFGAPAGDDIADLYRHLLQEPDALAQDGSGVVALGVVAEDLRAWAARQVWPARA